MAQVNVIIELVDTVTVKKQEWQRQTDKEGPGQYGYGPAVDQVQTVRRKLLEQTMDAADIDLKAVIRAINGL